MINYAMQELYKPYIFKLKEINQQAFLLNNNTPFKYKIFGTAQYKIIPSSETLEYLDPLVDEVTPVIKERILIQSWLLRLTNQLSNPHLILRILHKEITRRGIPLMHSTERDCMLLRQAEKAPENLIIKKRLLLRTMI